LEAATRDDYAPLFAFAMATGMRQSECLLRWSEVHWDAGQIRKTGKGGKLVPVPITPSIREILWPLRGHHPEYVLTYVAVRTHRQWVKGRRYPITLAGLRAHWHRLRKIAGVTGFRFHDFRHDLATKALRETGNLKLVQRMLNHADIRHTLRYAHVLDSEGRRGLRGRRQVAPKTPHKTPHPLARGRINRMNTGTARNRRRVQRASVARATPVLHLLRSELGTRPLPLSPDGFGAAGRILMKDQGPAGGGRPRPWLRAGAAATGPVGSALTLRVSASRRRPGRRPSVSSDLCRARSRDQQLPAPGRPPDRWQLPCHRCVLPHHPPRRGRVDVRPHQRCGDRSRD